MSIPHTGTHTVNISSNDPNDWTYANSFYDLDSLYEWYVRGNLTINKTAI